MLELCLHFLHLLNHIECTGKVVVRLFQIVRCLILSWKLCPASDVIVRTPLDLLRADWLVHLHVAPEGTHPHTPSPRVVALHRQLHELVVALQVEVAEGQLAAMGTLVGLSPKLLETRAAVDALTAFHLVRFTCREAADEANQSALYRFGELQIVASDLGRCDGGGSVVAGHCGINLHVFVVE